MEPVIKPYLVLLAAVLVCCHVEPVQAQSPRPTVQNRFATKTDTFYAHLTGAASLRNDFYHSLGGGLDAGYYFNETFGLELRWLWMANWEVDAAETIREDTGLIPDARPQNMLFEARSRYSFGYGKILVSDSVVHFDPQLTFGAGVALAEGRVLPTTTLGVALLTHYAYGIQAKLDLQLAFQLENRDRGWVPSFGFVPVLGVGWNFQGIGGSSP